MPGSIYLAGPLGFTESGRRYHDEVLRPAVAALGVELLDPWEVGGPIFIELGPTPSLPDLTAANEAAGAANRLMIERCAAVVAILDGSDVDSGTAAEIGYAAALGKPVIGLRTDIRTSGDNAAAIVNLQVVHFIELSGGSIVLTLDDALSALAALLDR